MGAELSAPEVVHRTRPSLSAPLPKPPPAPLSAQDSPTASGRTAGSDSSSSSELDAEDAFVALPPRPPLVAVAPELLPDDTADAEPSPVLTCSPQLEQQQ